MKNIFTLLLLCLSMFTSAQDGVLDPSFGGTGIISTSVPGGEVLTERLKVTVVSGDKIYQCYSISNTGGGPGDFGLVRYNSDGTIDATFNSGGANPGFVRTDVGGDDYATSLVVLADGHIIVAGYSTTATSVIKLAKYTSAGVLVASGFGTAGVVTTTVGTNDFAYSVIEQTDLKIVVAGYAEVAPGNFDFAVVRYTTAGVPDASFDTDGILTFNFGAGAFIDAAYSIKQQASDGKLVVAGFSAAVGASNVFAVARLTTSGGFDATFDGDGKQTAAIGTLDDQARSLDLAPGGKIVLGGYTSVGVSTDFAVVRFTATGSLDNTFNGTGMATANVGTTADPTIVSEDFGQDVLAQVDGKILLAGYLSYGAPPTDFAIMRFNIDGTVDNTFGPNPNGRNVISPGGDDFSYSLALQSSKILMGGITGNSLAIVRLNNTPPTPVPVTLTQFNAAKENGVVKINWQTSFEDNVAHYEVERSANGMSFISIGSVAPTGSTSTTTNYSHKDVQPFATLNYYRLKIVDNGGSHKYSRVVAIKFSGTSALQAFPNPVKSLLNVQVTVPAGLVRIQLTDATGRVVKTQQLNAQEGTIAVPVDMSNLKRGMYVLMVNGERLKIVKE